MSGQSFAELLEQLLAQLREGAIAADAERAEYRMAVRDQNIRLAVGRLKIDAARAALEAQNARPVTP